MKQCVEPESMRAENWQAATMVARLMVEPVRMPESMCMEIIKSSSSEAGAVSSGSPSPTSR
jgi:hypothetical protein